MPSYAAAFIARRSGNGHIGALVRQLDDILYVAFVISYILDANFLNLLIKSISQLQFSAPKEHHPERSLKFHIAACFAVNFLNIIYHLGVPLTQDPRGIVIDFVGQTYLPNKLQLLSMDVAAGFLQAFLIIITYETGHYGVDALLDDTRDYADLEDSNGEAEPGSSMSVGKEDGEGQEDVLLLDGESQPVLDLRLQQTINRIMHDKPISVASQDGDTVAAPDNGTSETAAQLSRIQARVRGRRRQQNYSSALQAHPPDERLDIQSDEEREVGLPSTHRT